MQGLGTAGQGWSPCCPAGLCIVACAAPGTSLLLPTGLNQAQVRAHDQLLVRWGEPARRAGRHQRAALRSGAVVHLGPSVPRAGECMQHDEGLVQGLSHGEGREKARLPLLAPSWVRRRAPSAPRETPGCFPRPAGPTCSCLEYHRAVQDVMLEMKGSAQPTPVQAETPQMQELFCILALGCILATDSLHSLGQGP